MAIDIQNLFNEVLDDAELDEIGESRFSDIVSSLGRRSEWRNGQRM